MRRENKQDERKCYPVFVFHEVPERASWHASQTLPAYLV